MSEARPSQLWVRLDEPRFVRLTVDLAESGDGSEMLTVKFDRFNDPVTVTAPAGAETIMG